MAKLIGLLKSPTGIVHGLKDENNRTALCGYKHNNIGSIPYSARTSVTCNSCKKRIPNNIY